MVQTGENAQKKLSAPSEFKKKSHAERGTFSFTFQPKITIKKLLQPPDCSEAQELFLLLLSAIFLPNEA